MFIEKEIMLPIILPKFMVFPLEIIMFFLIRRLD
ncbi:hypothetical protein LINPERPRIM_LOCUS1785 [Linum perenne]